MALTDLFRPKYKHSDSQVRANAVEQMGADEADLLVKIAESDKDPEVRRLAVSKLDDADALIDLVANEKNPAVRRAAHRRAGEIWSRSVLGGESNGAMAAISHLAMLEDQRYLAEVALKADEAKVRNAALERITDERSLSEIARRGPDSATRREALSRIEDPEVLRGIAMDETRKPLGLAAVERISDPATLESVASKAKNKHVRARAKKRKQELTVESKPKTSSEEKRLHAERVQLARTAKKHASSSEWIESHRIVLEAQARWEEVGDGSDADLAAKFAKNCARFLSRYQSVGVKALEAARERAEAKKREEELAAAAPESLPEPAQEEPQPEASEARSEAVAAARAKAKELDAEEKKAIREKREKVNLARLEALCIELEELSNIERYREADRKLAQVGKTYSSLKLPLGDERDALVARYEEARRNVLIQAQDLRKADEWKRWSVLPKLEGLIKSAEELLAREEIGQLGRDLKKLQADWKSTGPGPHSRNQELWEKFKEVCDNVYERVREQRKVAAAEQAENFDKKQELVEKAEALAESTDWDQTAQAIKDLQREWKAIGPVPRKKSKQQWGRFRGACDAFFERRKPILEERFEEHRENLEKKQAICTEMEALAEAEGEWSDTLDALKELRHRWRQVGHVPRENYAAISERYRAAGDRVFARREEAEKAKLDEARREVEELIAKLDGAMQKVGVDSGWEDEDVADASDEAEMVKAAVELRKAAIDLDDQGSEQRERARALIRAALESSPEAFDSSELDPQTSRRRRLRLIEKLEALLPSKEEDSTQLAELSPEEVAAKLREALAANALGIVSQEQRPVSEIVAEIRTSWELIGPVPGRDGLELNERFEVARQRVLDHYADEDDED